MMKPGLKQWLIADTQPSRRARSTIDKKVRVKGLSAACKKKRHPSCSSLSCKCICHHNFNRK